MSAGAGEIGVGASISNTGLLAPLWGGLIVHGVDYFLAGYGKFIDGTEKESLSSRALHYSGLSQESASAVNDALNAVATLGLGVCRAGGKVFRFAKGSTKAFGLAKGSIPKGVQLNRFHASAKNLSYEGKNNIRFLRKWAKSKGWQKAPNSKGAPEKWGLEQNNDFKWYLKIKPESSFRGGLDKGSNIPRFSARLKDGVYINPFTGEVGNHEVGAHLLLDYNYTQ